MSFSDDLLQHSLELLGEPVTSSDRYLAAIYIRRAVSASYYALFHHLCEASVNQVAQGLPARAQIRIYRSLNHGEIKRVCKDFSSNQPSSLLRDLVDAEVSDEMQKVALTLIKLQEARHAADYDPSYEIDRKQANQFIASAIIAIQVWERIKNTSEARIFILLLLLRKNWENERR